MAKKDLHPVAKKHGFKSNEEFYKAFPTQQSYEMKFGGQMRKVIDGDQLSPYGSNFPVAVTNDTDDITNGRNAVGKQAWIDNRLSTEKQSIMRGIQSDPFPPHDDPNQITHSAKPIGPAPYDPSNNSITPTGTTPFPVATPAMGNMNQAQLPNAPVFSNTSDQPSATKKGKPFIDVKNPLKKANWNPEGGVNTNDIFSTGTAVIAGALPFTPVKQNQNVMPGAINPYPNGIPGSRATYKNGGKLKKALEGANISPITTQERNNWNNMQGAAYQQGFLGDNHNKQSGVDFMKSHGVDPNRLPAYQQDFQNLSGTGQVSSGAQGYSGVDNFFGNKTSQQKYRRYEVVEPNGKTTNYGTDMAGAQTNVNNFLHPGKVQNQWQSNDQNIPMDAPQAQIDTLYQQPIAKVQKGNYHTNENADYSIDSTRTMAYGGVVLVGQGGVQVDNNQFEMISPDTMKLKGNYHSSGGTDIAANGQEVEAEKNETIHTDNEGNVVVGGNMYMPGTNTKFKNVFTDIAKQEKKIGKTKDKASFFLNNYDPNSRYQSYAFNTGTVLADAYEQKNQKIQDVKQHVTDVQNQLLDIADTTGANPSKVSNLFKGKAKYGMELPKTASGKVLSEQQQMLRDHPELVTEALSKYGKPRAGKFDDGLPGPRTDFVKNYVAKKTKQDIAPLPTGGPKPITLDRYYNGTVNTMQEPETPYMPGYVNSPTPLDTAKPFPTSVPDMQQVHTVDEGTNPMAATTPPGKKVVQGMRNKFRPGQYIGEFMSMLDQPEQVPSTQVNPILESEYNISLQSKKNAIQSAYAPTLKNAGNNPAAQAAITAQMAEQLGGVDSEEMGVNQQNQGAIRARNAQELRGTRDTNLQLTNDQRNKTQAAKDNAKENRYRGLLSFETKEAQRRASNTQLGMAENMAGWAYNPTTNSYQMIHPGYQYQDMSINQFDPSKQVKSKEEIRNGNKKTTTTTESKFFGGKVASKKKKKPNMNC